MPNIEVQKQVEELNIAMGHLADNTHWIYIRKNFLEPRIADIADVRKPFLQSGFLEDKAAEFYARQRAARFLQDFLDSIDALSGTAVKPDETKYD